jgi:hypothetical protein
VLLLALAWSGPARAIAIPIFFTGDGGFVVSASDAASSGLPMKTADFVGSIDGTLAVVGRTLDQTTVVPLPPTAPSGNRATSAWTVRNASTADLDGDVYLLFLTSDPFDVPGTSPTQTISYADANVGFMIDPADGWLLIAVDVPAGAGGTDTFYYPAIELGSLAPQELAEVFDLNYVVNEALQDAPLNRFYLPKLRLGLGFTPIPEPTTAALLALGLVGLAVQGHRRRS